MTPDLWCQAGDGWASYFDPDVPVGGHPLDDVTSSTILDSVPTEDRTNVVARTAVMSDASAQERAAMTAALEWLRATLPGDDEDDESIDRAFLPLEDRTTFIEDALEWDVSDIDEYGPLLLFAI